jgi:aspartate dehydrogenase
VENAIDLNSITEKTKLFGGYALEAAKAFPANVNVAATLSLAGIGADKTWVEVWADPAALGNSHEIRVIGGYSTITAKVENTPDPANPKSSMITAQSVISLLKNLHEPFAVF